MWHLYILFCDNKIFYVGVTGNLKNRIAQHKNKESKYTKQFQDIKLVYSEKYFLKKLAEKRETQIKKWTVAKKKALIKGDKKLLKKLSKGPAVVDVSLDV